MKETKLFGIVPGVKALALPPWLAAYFIIAIPFVFAFKGAFRVY